MYSYCFIRYWFKGEFFLLLGFSILFLFNEYIYILPFILRFTFMYTLGYLATSLFFLDNKLDYIDSVYPRYKIIKLKFKRKFGFI